MDEKEKYLNTLRKEKYFADHILDNSRSMISVINREYVYEKVNSTFCKAQKELAEEIVGKSLVDVWGKDIFRKKIKNNIDRCFNGSTVRYEASFSVPQTGRRFFEVVFRPFPVSSGEITHILAETFDITDLKLSEKLIIEKEEEFRKLETSLPIGYIRCKPDGKIIHSNKAFMMIMECDNEEPVSFTNLGDCYSEKDLFRLHIERLQDCKPLGFGRVSLKTCRGNEIVCRISGYMTMGRSGKPSYIDFSIEDASRELMLENRLLQAQKLETVGALAGGIAHDFNNILATISGYSELLKDDLPKSSPSSQKVAKIMLAVSKARSLTNQILTFSRQVEQEKVQVNVYEVLKETTAFMKSAIPSNVKLRTSIRPKEAPVFADPTQLFRVFLNLMTNAIQAMEERSGIISVSLTLVAGKKVRNVLEKSILADEYVLVTFRDQGKGMDQSHLRRIFEPFFTTREVGKGSGLGLSVVHGIVSEMGGEVLVSSHKGTGSVFYVYLPVSREDVRPPVSPEKHKKILFITGNKHESRIISLALESTGYEMIQPPDLKNIQKILSDKSLNPDLIIYMNESEYMPAGDLLGMFQSYDLKIPCILISDSDQDFLEEKLVNSGIVSQHLIKPVSLKEIKDAIQLSL